MPCFAVASGKKCKFRPFLVYYITAASFYSLCSVVNCSTHTVTLMTSSTAICMSVESFFFSVIIYIFVVVLQVQ